jgi:hypothetical protein
MINRVRRSHTFIGIDGEGQTVRPSDRAHIGDHRYVFLAAADERGAHWHCEDDLGLSTETCLDFLLNKVPTDGTLLFAYSFNYDLTKILKDLPDEKLYLLFRPEERMEVVWRYGRKSLEARPVRWRGYKLNLQSVKFTLSAEWTKTEVVLWDLFKFFQSKFVSAIKDWKVGDAALHDRMQKMKDKRAEFDSLPKEQVHAYCFEECVCMAQLARKLVDAHAAAGLELKSFYGAGSSASAMLGEMGIKKQIRPAPKAMRDALSRSFFGGRFENSVIGTIRGSVYNYDISSAYPYQITFLPCLMHGAWEYTRKRTDLEGVRTAFVRYAMGPAPRDPKFQSWGPFPFRTSDGSISFPIESGGGWVGLDEYIAGERLFPHVFFQEAWIYKCDCDCQPFARIPEFYKERIRIGKEGPGIVLKLGYNACYGKLAQSVGSRAFSSWIWASLITSGTRAQILELLGLHADWSNLLMIATDGVYTRERLTTPLPRETGTWDLPCPDGRARKPLGGWEEKRIDKGVFVARPGIYFPMMPTAKELKDVRGRGVGKSVVLENWARIVEHWERHHLDPTPERPRGVPCIVSNVSRFCGAKSSVGRSVRAAYNNGEIDWAYGRASGIGECAAGCKHAGCGHVPSYGQWIMRPVEMSFDPMPKRERLRDDGLTLQIRSFPLTLQSWPYKKALVSEEAAELIAAKEELLEQPDGDFRDADLMGDEI